MKTNNTLTKLLMLVAIVTLSMTYTTNAKADECSPDDLWCCLVRSNGNTDVYSLETYLTLFNMPEGQGFCRDAIEFGVSDVYVKKAIELKVNDTSAEFNLGNAEGITTLNVDDIAGDAEAIITIGTDNGAVNDIVIRGLKIVGNKNNLPLIKCQGKSQRVRVENVSIDNYPVNPWDISNCADFTVSGVSLTGQGEGADGFIAVENSENFSFINNPDAGQTLLSMTGPVISISNTNNYTLGGIEASYDSSSADASDAAITITNSYGTIDGITISDAPLSGIKFQDINNGEKTKFSGKITLDGYRESGTTGLILDNAYGMSLTSLEVTNFDTGVSVGGDSEKNTFTDDTVYIHNNITYGFELADSASMTRIQATKIIDQVYGCGIYFNSSGQNMVFDNNLYNNDLCGVKVGENSSVAQLNEDDIVVLAQGQSSVRVTLNVDNTDIKMIEFHQVQSDMSAYTTQTVGPKRGRKSLLRDMIAGNSNNQKSSSGTARVSKPSFGTFGSGVVPVKNSGKQATDRNYTHKEPTPTEGDDESQTGGSASSEKSWLGRFETSQMPYPIDNVNPNASFFALAYNGPTTDAKVIAVWSGTAKTDASAYTENPGCYWTDETQSWTRLYDPDPVTGDFDSDGILDWYEDANQNCAWDQATETKVDDNDTDDDGILDGTEDADHDGQYDEGIETKATVKDTDGDGLADGIEDSNFDGNWDGLTDEDNDGVIGETNALLADSDSDGLGDSLELQYGTNPLVPDSDGDGMLDGNPDEKCPLVPGTENCYYNNCIKADNADVSAAVSSGNDTFDGEADGYCDDADGDEICSQDEDKNSNCQWDAGETNANNADTDGDGIADGGANGEDIDHDGSYDSDQGESNPVSTDSDGDGILDGLEMSHAEWFAGSGKGDRTMADTDGDLISDGDEDSSPSGALNGVVDAGETDPSLADTDSDGTNDDTDICPWSQDSSCVVRYCNVNGYDSYDADGDGLPDKDEDTDGDCAWTKSNKEGSPIDADSDDDGLADNYEDCFGTNPVSSDTDGDGRNDFEEVESSIDQCTTMFNLGDTNPLNAEFGGCSLNKNLATKDGVMPITIMIVAALTVMMIKRKQART